MRKEKTGGLWKPAIQPTVGGGYTVLNKVGPDANYPSGQHRGCQKTTPARSGDLLSGALTQPKCKMHNQKLTYNFTLILSGVTEPTNAVEDALFNAGCDDAILAFRNNIAYLEFDRKATSHEQAVLSAIRAVEKAGVGLKVEHVEPSDSVTASEISRRLNCTRENVRLLTQGRRANLNFPPPYSGISTEKLIWSWADVARTLYAKGKIRDKKVVIWAEYLREINTALEIREGKLSMTRCKKLAKDMELTLA